MRVVFVTSGYENLGVESLSAHLKRDGHDVRLFFDPKVFGGGIFLKIDFLNQKFDLRNKIVSQVLQCEPDIIGFSCMSHNYLWCLDIASQIKKNKNIPIMFGGIHPTLLPEEVLSQECIDMVAIGEAEISLCSLLKNMEKGLDRVDTRGIYFKKNGRIISNPVEPLCSDLDSFPFLDKTLFYEKMPAFSKTPYSIMAGKGCLFSCSYCCNDYLKKIYKGYQFCRIRSVKHVIAELKDAKQKYNVKRVAFYDEVFPNKVSWLEEFSREYKKEINLPFTIYYHFGLCDEMCISLLKNANCDKITFGLQSVSERIRRDICNRLETDDQVVSAVKLCKKYKIDVIIDHIFGLPTDTEEDQRKAVEFYRELAPHIIYTYWLVYYPETNVINIALDANILSESDKKIINSGIDTFYHKGFFIKNRKSLMKYELMLDLIPLLPSKLHKRICENDIIVRLLSRGYYLHFFLLFLSGMRLKEKPFLNNLKLLISKKFVP